MGTLWTYYSLPWESTRAKLTKSSETKGTTIPGLSRYPLAPLDTLTWGTRGSWWAWGTLYYLCLDRDRLSLRLERTREAGV